jgi:sugar/nucleoside kinase (ribokinase family)
MKVVNTTGAGDAFLGSFAASKAMGRSDPEALSRANAAGAVKVTLAETRLVVERERLRSLIERFSAMIRPEGPVPWDRSDGAS